jgi:hypothetical protein
LARRLRAPGSGRASLRTLDAPPSAANQQFERRNSAGVLEFESFEQAEQHRRQRKTLGGLWWLYVLMMVIGFLMTTCSISFSGIVGGMVSTH